MSTFTTYNTIIEMQLANTSEVFYDSEMKRQAANDTIKELLIRYDIPEMIRKPQTTGLLTFTSGKVTKPTDYYRMVKLWGETSGVQDKEYQYLEPDEFDRRSATDSYYWTEDADPSDAVRKLWVLPSSTTTVYCRYIKAPTDMTDDDIDSGLSSAWDECVALGTTMRLLQNAGRYDEAREFERLYRQKTAEVYLSVKNPGGIKQNSRLKSKYERIYKL